MAEGKPRQGPIREKPQLIADELRALIVAGDLSEGESLGHEPDLIERFGVSRPSLREALRILEAEGLISVVRGASGGVVVHEPNERMTARTAALVLQARNVSLADVHQARSLLEPAAAATIARSGRRRSAGNQLALLIDEQETASGGPRWLRRRERRVPRATRHPRRQPDADDRGGDAQRDRVPGGHCGVAGRAERAVLQNPSTRHQLPATPGRAHRRR